MKNILITGATGNVGIEVMHYLRQSNTNLRVVAGVRNVEKAKVIFRDYDVLDYVYFDFENVASYDGALENVDRVFLLRPPHIADVDRVFKPLLTKMKTKGIKDVVFLSVQGAEKSKVIPHNKIERLILDLGFNYIFLRPSYFMQNLTTTLVEDIKQKRSIILPSADALFNWVDIENIGEVSAILLDTFEMYKNKAYEITGNENASFEQVVAELNQVVKDKVTYQRVNPFQFYRIKKQDGMEKGMIIVMLLLHFLPRFQKAPRISNFYEMLTHKKPTCLSVFLEREKMKFED